MDKLMNITYIILGIILVILIILEINDKNRYK